MSPREDTVFLAKYREKYGVGAYNYLVRTYRAQHIGGTYHSSTNLSGQTMGRILQLVPTVMSTDERFAIFEEIINNTEPELYGNGKTPMALETVNLAYSFSDWVAGGEQAVLRQLEDAAAKELEGVNFRQKYNFDAIKWLADNDIDAFCTLLENARKAIIVNRLSTSREEVSRLRKKWLDIENGTTRPGRTKMLEYQAEIGNKRFLLQIYDGEERKRLESVSRIQNLGCFAVFILLLVLLFALAKGR